MNTPLTVKEREEHGRSPDGHDRTSASPLSTEPEGFSARSKAFVRAAIVVVAPAVVLAGTASHPWIGNPGDPDFLARLGAAVTADPVHWGLSHLVLAVGSGLLALAFLAIRGYLREAGEERWSALGLPFVILGSTLYSLLPAMEFAPLAAAESGADAAAAQGALLPWFHPVLLAAAAVFAVGALGYVLGVVRGRVMGTNLTWLVAAALVVMAVARFFPVGVVQLYVGPAAGVVALWPLAYAIWRRPEPPPVL